MITGVVKAKRPASGASRASSSSFGPSRPVAGGQRCVLRFSDFRPRPDRPGRPAPADRPGRPAPAARRPPPGEEDSTCVVWPPFRKLPPAVAAPACVPRSRGTGSARPNGVVAVVEAVLGFAADPGTAALRVNQVCHGRRWPPLALHAGPVARNAKSQPEHERSLRQFEDALDSKKSREAAFACLWSLSKVGFEPYILALFPKLLEHLGDKDGLVRDSALAALKALESSVSTYAVSEFVTALFVGLSEQQRWQTKTGTLALLSSFASTSPTQIRSLLPQVIPHLSNAMWDTKSEVKVAAKECLTKMCTLIGNPDIENVVPEIVDSIVNPDRVPEVIDLLGLTTFVKKMEAPTLTIMVPLLIRALVERSVPLRRKTGLIIESMCKLVDDPEIVAPFLPSLLPCLKKTEDETADPDCLEVLQQLAAGGSDSFCLQVASMMATLKAIVSVGEFVPSYYFPLLSYAASIAETLV
ncbi:MAG: armadillo-type protein, partial [Olpidium bornovanus]